MLSTHIKNRFKTERVKTARGRKVSSTKWLQRQINDPYVKEAQKRGYRSRAAFKILEINEKFKLFKKGYRVLDLGSAPGGWSQIIVDIVGENNILATDILKMEPISGVKFVQKNFLDDDAKDVLISEMNGQKYDVVVSDNALDFAIEVLKDGGFFVAKVFQGGAEKSIFDKLKTNFKMVKHFKPESSRKDSVEMYVIAKEFKGNKNIS